MPFLLDFGRHFSVFLAHLIDFGAAGAPPEGPKNRQHRPFYTSVKNHIDLKTISFSETALPAMHFCADTLGSGDVDEFLMKGVVVSSRKESDCRLLMLWLKI